MKLSLSLAKKLLKLVQNKSINSSEFRNPSKLEELIEEGVVHLQVKGQNTKILLLSEYKLYIHLKRFGINSLEDYTYEGMNESRSRSSLSHVSNNTKSFKTQVQAGLYLASFEPLEIGVDSEMMSIYTPNMSSFFLHKNASLELSDDIVIIGVENFENLTSISKQKTLFKDIEKKVFMYRNKYARDFLSKSFNTYLHFGDFDLAGVNIFLNEIVPRLPHERHRFFIPNNISELLKNGNSEDYFVQMKKYPNLTAKAKYL